VDPLADALANFGSSSYLYVWASPLRFVDPTGMHGENDFGLGKAGRVVLLRETKDDTDKLIALDADGTETDRSVEVEKGVLSQLVNNNGKLRVSTYWGEKRGTYANTSNGADALKVFKFASDNSDVEWGLIASKSGKYTIGTLFEDSVVGGLLAVSGFELTDLSFDYHSHPGGPSKIGDYASDIGDQAFASRQMSKLLEQGVSYENLPRYYIYRPHVDKPYRFEYSPWKNKFNVNRVYSWKNL